MYQYRKADPDEKGTESFRYLIFGHFVAMYIAKLIPMKRELKVKSYGKTDDTRQ